MHSLIVFELFTWVFDLPILFINTLISPSCPEVVRYSLVLSIIW